MDSTCGHFPDLRGLVGKLRGSQVTHWTHQKIGQSQRPFEEDQIFHLCLHIHSEDSDLLCQVMKRCDGSGLFHHANLRHYLLQYVTLPPSEWRQRT